LLLNRVLELLLDCVLVLLKLLQVLGVNFKVLDLTGVLYLGKNLPTLAGIDQGTFAHFPAAVVTLS
jgi:hypothetical protein